MTTSAQLKMHYEWPSQLHSLRTLHLFAGIGGGLLADNILGHHPVCAVEIDTYLPAKSCSAAKKRFTSLVSHL
jgi:uncharacterized membrane protein YeiH